MVKLEYFLLPLLISFLRQTPWNLLHYANLFDSSMDTFCSVATGVEVLEREGISPQLSKPPSVIIMNIDSSVHFSLLVIKKLSKEF